MTNEIQELVRSGKVTAREMNRRIAHEARQFSHRLELIHEQREYAGPHATLVRVWRSRHFLVQLYEEAVPDREGTTKAMLRLSVNRSRVRRDGSWEDGITWDELQRLKDEAGLGDMWAVEVYPAEGHVVQDANMRHLWLLPERPLFAWTSANRARTETA